MSLEQVWERAGHGVSEAVTEFHIVGGLHPELTLDWYCQMLRGLKERYPQVHLKAFTMVEIGFLANRAKIGIRETLEKLRDAGMDSMPGGGAEIFSERVRRIICDHKITGDQWLDVARTAHKMGLHSNCTMLYGHVETEEDRVDHLIKLRALQDETKGFVTFIPLAFHPENTALEHIAKTTGFDDIREIAVSRLMLDNIPHIKAYWIMMTPRIAQIAQRFGADDIDGTVIEEKIYHDAGATDQPESAPRRPAPPDPRSRPRAPGARHALSSRRAHRKRLHGFRLASYPLHHCRGSTVEWNPDSDRGDDSAHFASVHVIRCEVPRSLAAFFLALTLSAITDVRSRIGKTSRAGRSRRPYRLERRPITYANTTLLMSCPRLRPKAFQIDGPGWILTERYDIQAKAPDNTQKDQIPLMLQALLTERFQLKLHRESREMPVYFLVTGKGAAKYQKSEGDLGYDMATAAGY